MLRIGEFSTLSQISIYMLRHYDEIELMQRQLTLIESTIKGLGHPSPIPSYSVALKEFPKHNVISYRQIITTPDQEGILWAGLAKETKGLNLHYTSPQWSFMIGRDMWA